jgi:RNA polymerase sigma-70 factor, ECF subfamily
VTKSMVAPLDADEASLVRALQSGEAEAFASLVRTHAARLLTVARRFLGSEEDARDALQDTFVAAFKSIGGFEGKSRLYTWLYRILINVCLARLRTKQRRREGLIDDVLPRFLADGHQAHPAQDWSDPPDAPAQRRETRELIRQAIDQLPEDYRTVLLLRDIEELDTNEAARVLEVTAGVVKTRLHRARQALRTILDPHFRGGSL